MLWEPALCWGGFGEKELKLLVFLIDIFVFLYFLCFVFAELLETGGLQCVGADLGRWSSSQ